MHSISRILVQLVLTINVYISTDAERFFFTLFSCQLFLFCTDYFDYVLDDISIRWPREWLL